MLAEMHAEALILCANEYGANDVAGKKEEEESVMQMWVMQCIKN